MRLIDADKLIEWIKKTYCEGCDNYNGMRCKACPNDDEIRDINSAPTIDAVSVVRCKDCMWWINNLTEFSADEDFLQCRWNEKESPNADDFCIYGERKGE